MHGRVCKLNSRGAYVAIVAPDNQCFVCVLNLHGVLSLPWCLLDCNGLCFVSFIIHKWTIHFGIFMPYIDLMLHHDT